MLSILRRTSCLALILTGLLSCQIVFAASTKGTISCSSAENSLRVTGNNAEPLLVPSLQFWAGGKGLLKLSKHPRIVVEQQNSAALLPVARQLASELHSLTGHNVSVRVSDHVGHGDIGLSLRPCGSATQTKIGDEGYSLDAHKNVIIRANTAHGAFYGTRTLLQMLLLEHQSAHSRRWSVPRGLVVDYPRYKVRSVMVDVARKFVSVPALQALMREMSWYKLNRLHLHLNDQADSLNANGKLGYPFAIKAFRLKSNNPAFAKLIPADGQFYTHSDWNALEDTAAKYGIAIEPEFDTPAHAAAFVAARPDLEYHYKNNPQDTSTLDVRNPATLAYVESVFNQFLPWFRSKYISIGGDEVAGIPVAEQAAYLNALSRYLQSRGKIVSMWGEKATPDWTKALDKNIVIEWWWSASPNEWGPAGFKNINSPWTTYVVAKPGDPSHILHGSTVYNGWNKEVNQKFPPFGGQICIWNDWAVLNYSQAAMLAQLQPAIPAAGQVFWLGQVKDASGKTVPYSKLKTQLKTISYQAFRTAENK